MNNELRRISKQDRLRPALAVAWAVSLVGCVTPGAASTREETPTQNRSAGGQKATRTTMDAQQHQDTRASRAANPHLDPNRLAEELIRVGEDGIAKENDAALNAYFAPNYLFHGPQ